VATATAAERLVLRYLQAARLTTPKTRDTSRITKELAMSMMLFCLTALTALAAGYLLGKFREKKNCNYREMEY
jgi:fatty acid desaturase